LVGYDCNILGNERCGYEWGIHGCRRQRHVDDERLHDGGGGEFVSAIRRSLFVMVAAGYRRGAGGGALDGADDERQGEQKSHHTFFRVTRVIHATNPGIRRF
jgi:hypothetical protein